VLTPRELKNQVVNLQNIATYRTLAFGEVRSGFSVKSVGTLSDVRRMCELERTAICSMKVFGPKVKTWRIGGFVVLVRAFARHKKGRMRRWKSVNIFWKPAKRFW
jgi:hypothetical protein